MEFKLFAHLFEALEKVLNIAFLDAPVCTPSNFDLMKAHKKFIMRIGTRNKETLEAM